MNHQNQAFRIFNNQIEFPLVCMKHSEAFVEDEECLSDDEEEIGKLNENSVA